MFEWTNGDVFLWWLILFSTKDFGCFLLGYAITAGMKSVWCCVFVGLVEMLGLRFSTCFLPAEWWNFKPLWGWETLLKRKFLSKLAGIVFGKSHGGGMLYWVFDQSMFGHRKSQFDRSLFMSLEYLFHFEVLHQLVSLNQWTFDFQMSWLKLISRYEQIINQLLNPKKNWDSETNIDDFKILHLFVESTPEENDSSISPTIHAWDNLTLYPAVLAEFRRVRDLQEGNLNGRKGVAPQQQKTRWYGWWKRLVVYFFICKVLYIPVVQDFFHQQYGVPKNEKILVVSIIGKGDNWSL